MAARTWFLKIPFGKYKGQPIEVLAGDPKYADWLRQQDWFRNRFGGLYQIIINNFAEPSETPEHNRLRARLLDLGFCIKLAAVAEPKALDWHARRPSSGALHYQIGYGNRNVLKAEIDRLKGLYTLRARCDPSC
jgi:uncharacterized protein (DUF3820 family)